MATPISDLGKIRIFVESELLSGRTYRRLSSAPVCLEFWLLAGMMHRVEAPPDQQPPTGARHVHQTLVPALETADAIVYALVGMVFLAAALGMLAYSLVAFPANLRDSGFALGIVTLVNNLLLVMIIMEVLRTVLSYLQERGTSLQPFLFIAAISATRRILAIGAQMSVAGGTLSPDKFREAMLDLTANAGVILAIAIALYLLAHHASGGCERRRENPLLKRPDRPIAPD